MTTKSRRRTIRSLPDFYRYCELAGVRFTSLHAEAADDELVDEPGGAFLEASWEMREEDRYLVAEFRVRLRTESFQYRLSAAAGYRSKSDRPFRVTEEVAGGLINQSAVITVIPFLRECLMSLAGRVGDLPAPLLPLVGSGTGQRLVVVDDTD